MKIRDAKQVYSAQLDTLRTKKQNLSKLLKDSENGKAEMQVFDRVEISRELTAVSAQYKAVRNVMEEITSQENAIYSSEVAMQQSQTTSKAAEKTAKIMEVFRRISSGAKVPPSDERKLMEFSHEMYMAAKTAAMMAKKNEEEYDSLWKDEEEDAGELKDAHEIAGDADIFVPSAEDAAVETAAQSQEAVF